MVATARRHDTVWYPESDDMGEHELQRFIAELLRPLIERWLLAQGRVAHAGADQFFYWIEGDATASRAPDVYVIEGVAQGIAEAAVWKTWEGHVPTLAIEICGGEWQKDYDEAPADYESMGTREVLVFDPGATSRSRRRVRWQVFRRDRRGRLVCVQRSRGDRVRSEVLGCFVRLVDDKGHDRLRLATGERGDAIFPTGQEAAEGALEAERLARMAAEAARAAVEAENAQLRAEIERLRRAAK